MGGELSVKLAGDCNWDVDNIDSDAFPMATLRPAFDLADLFELLVIPLVQVGLRANRHIHKDEA